jgi:hypothetical protein
MAGSTERANSVPQAVADCPSCPVPPRIGEPQPDRCDRCPYKGFIHVVEEVDDGGRLHRFVAGSAETHE